MKISIANKERRKTTMISMQYKISLPDNYNMNIIRKRVADNGHKTDGFQDLIFKAYLISEKKGSFKNSNEYSPLYIWKNNEGMNKFIFNGYYDNILSSFGWQKINIGIPITCCLGKDFHSSKFTVEIEHEITPTKKMKAIKFSFDKDNCTGKVLIYNPYKWKYVEYYFYKNVPNKKTVGKIYKILHLSQ